MGYTGGEAELRTIMLILRFLEGEIEGDCMQLLQNYWMDLLFLMGFRYCCLLNWINLDLRVVDRLLFILVPLLPFKPTLGAAFKHLFYFF